MKRDYNQLSEGFLSIPSFFRRGESTAEKTSVFDALPTAIWVLDFEKVISVSDIMVKELNTDLKSLLNSTKYYLKLISLIQITTVNHAAVQLYKSSSKEALKQEFLSVFVDFESSEFKLFMLNVLSNKLQGEYIGGHKNVIGEDLNVRVNYKADEGGSISVFCVVVENKKTELEAVKPVMRVLKNTLKEAGWIYDFKSKKIKWSDEFFQFFKIKNKDVSDGVSAILDHTHPKDKLLLMKHYTSLFQLTDLTSVNFTIVLEGEVEHEVKESYTVIKDNISGDVKFIIAHISTLENPRSYPVEKEMSYEYIASGKIISFLWKATDGWPVEHVSANVESLLGYTVKDFTEGRLKYQDIIHKDDLIYLIEKANYISSSGNEINTLKPYRIISKSGEIKWIVARFIVQKNNQGKVTHYNGFIEDVTKSKSLEIVVEKINTPAIGLTGQEYLNEVVRGITGVLGADYLVVSYCSPARRNIIELVSSYSQEGFLDLFSYSAKGTPCSLVLSEGTKIYNRNVTKVFPLDTDLIDMEAEAYLGVHFKNNKNEPIGYIAAIYKSPLKNERFHLDVIEQFVNRIGAEVQELKLKELLVKKEEEARALFIDSPIAMWIEDYTEIYRFLMDIKKKKIGNFRTYLEEKPDVFAEVLKLVKIVEINDKCVEVTKASSKRELKERFHELVTKSSMEIVKEILISFYKGNYTFTGEMTIRNFKGAYRNVAISLLVPNKNRVLFDRVIISIVDITKSIKMVQSLSQNKLYLENYIDSIPLPSMMWDTDYKCIKWNKTAEGMFGYSEKEMLGKDFKTLFSFKKSYGTYKGLWLKKLEKNGKLQQETSNIKKNGEIIDCSWNVTLVKIANSKAFGFITLAENITERKKEQRRKNAISRISKAAISTISEKDFYKLTHKEVSKFLDAENFFIAVLDGNSSLLHKKFIVSTKGEGTIDLEIDASLTGLVVKNKRSLLLKTQEINDLKLKHNIKTIGEETKIWLGAPLVVQDKCIGAIVLKNFKSEVSYTQKDLENLELIANSISGVIERKRVGKKLKKALKKALQSESLKTSFLANMSHEIRTPMNGIVGFSELLSNPKLEENDRKHYTQLIIDSSNQLLNIVNDILDISQIEAGMIHLKTEIFDANSLMQHLIELHKVKAKEKGIGLFLDPFIRKDLSINTDKTKLIQVLSNLVSNAIKFTNNGYVRIGYYLKNDMLEFYVEDSGIGIPEKFHSKIFNRFIQTNEKVRKQTKGNGLGLAICKSFVELFGGEIWIDKSSNEGTKICFNLPYGNLKTVKISPVSIDVIPVDELQKDDVTLLIAEDEKNNMMYLEEVFSRTNYTLVQVENGQEAVDACANNSAIDIVLMDVKMPIMNGLDATEIIKESRPNLPVIALSAFAMESDIKYAISKGCDSYISKPINRKLLLKTIVEYVSKAKGKQV